MNEYIIINSHKTSTDYKSGGFFIVIPWLEVVGPNPLKNNNPFILTLFGDKIQPDPTLNANI